MKRFFLLTLSLGLVIALIVGCGDEDNTPTDPVTLETGNPDDIEFLAAQEVIYGSEDFSDEMFVWMDFLMDSVFFEGSLIGGSSSFTAKIASDTVFATYHGDSEYWYFYFSSIDTVYGTGQVIEDILTFTLYDSIQFLHGQNAVQWPDSALLTAVQNGALIIISAQSGLGNASGTQDITIAGEAGAICDRGNVTLDGTRTFDLGISEEGGQCSVTLDANSTATAIAMNVTEMDEGGCPQSGNLNHVGTIVIECTGDTTFTFSDTWTFDQTFFGDTIQVVVENSTTRWAFTDTCEVSGGVTRPYAELFAKIRER